MTNLPMAWDDVTIDLDALVAAKDGRTVSVVLPALNEEATVAQVISTIKPLCGSLIDELVVLDSGSTDNTITIARDAGARVVKREDVLTSIPPVPGKGEVLWRSLAATSGDLIAFIDSDLIDPDSMFVPKLLLPLLIDENIQLVKGYYRRPLHIGSQIDETGGGRVTELVARPLLTALKPALAEVIQPLGGEYAGTRELFAAIPFAPGYGVEIGILIDTYNRLGPRAIGQVNLGIREHRNRPLKDLAVMSRQIIGTMFQRCGITDSAAALPQFDSDSQLHWHRHAAKVSLIDRPPINSLTIHSVD